MADILKGCQQDDDTETVAGATGGGSLGSETSDTLSPQSDDLETSDKTASENRKDSLGDAQASVALKINEGSYAAKAAVEKPVLARSKPSLLLTQPSFDNLKGEDLTGSWQSSLFGRTRTVSGESCRTLSSLESRSSSGDGSRHFSGESSSHLGAPRGRGDSGASRRQGWKLRHQKQLGDSIHSNEVVRPSSLFSAQSPTPVQQLSLESPLDFPSLPLCPASENQSLSPLASPRPKQFTDTFSNSIDLSSSGQWASTHQTLAQRLSSPSTIVMPIGNTDLVPESSPDDFQVVQGHRKLAKTFSSPACHIDAKLHDNASMPKRKPLSKRLSSPASGLMARSLDFGQNSSSGLKSKSFGSHDHLSPSARSRDFGSTGHIPASQKQKIFGSSSHIQSSANQSGAISIPGGAKPKEGVSSTPVTPRQSSLSPRQPATSHTPDTPHLPSLPLDNSDFPPLSSSPCPRRGSLLSSGTGSTEMQSTTAVPDLDLQAVVEGADSCQFSMTSSPRGGSVQQATNNPNTPETQLHQSFNSSLRLADNSRLNLNRTWSNSSNLNQNSTNSANSYQTSNQSSYKVLAPGQLGPVDKSLTERWVESSVVFTQDMTEEGPVESTDL